MISSSSTPILNKAGFSTLSDQIKYVCEKISTKLQTNVESLGKAKLIVRYIRQLKCIISDETNLNLITNVLIDTNIYGYFMINYSKLLQFGILADETLRCILTIIRQKSPRKRELSRDLVEHGVFLFTLSALRSFDTQESIRVQALELLSSSIEYITADTETNEQAKPPIQDTIRLLVLNGVTTVLPYLFTFYTETKNEVSTRRVISCLKFVFQHSPHELAMTILTINNWSTLRCLIQVMYNFSVISAIEATELIIFAIATSPFSADKLFGFGAMDEFSKLLASNRFIFKLHTPWLTAAFLNIKSLMAMAIGPKRFTLERFIKSLALLFKTHCVDENIYSIDVRDIPPNPLSPSNKTASNLLPAFPYLPITANAQNKKKKNIIKKEPVTLQLPAKGLPNLDKSVLLPSTTKPRQKLFNKEEWLGAINKVAERLFDAPALNMMVDDRQISVLDSLTYAERIQLMIMQVHEEMPGSVDINRVETEIELTQASEEDVAQSWKRGEREDDLEEENRYEEFILEGSEVKKEEENEEEEENNDGEEDYRDEIISEDSPVEEGTFYL